MTTHKLPRRIPEFGTGTHHERRLATALIWVICAFAIAYGAFPAVAHIINIIAVTIAIGTIVGLLATGLVLTLRAHRDTQQSRAGHRP